MTHGEVPVDYDPFAQGEVELVVPSTEPQREVIAAAAMSARANTAYNEAVSLRITGVLAAATVEQALRDLVDRHDALRATFTPQLDALCVTTRNDFRLQCQDLTGLAPAEQERQLQELWTQCMVTPMSLCDGPLLRAFWLQFGAQSAELVLLAHHAICDGWSFHVLLQELQQLCAGQPASALAPAPSFAAFAREQREREETDPDAGYWLARFADRPEAIDLPTDQPRPQRRTFDAQRIDHVLDSTVTQAVARAAARTRSSTVAVVVAGIAALMQRLTETEDVVLGMPVARQALDGRPGLVGHCVQLLPVRIAVDPAARFEQVVAAARSAVLDAGEHFDFTFGSLVRDLGYSGSAARVPLVPVLVNVDQPLAELRLGAARANVRSVPRLAEGFELFLNVVPHGETLVVEATFNRDLFAAATVRAWLLALERLLHSGALAPNTMVRALRLADDAHDAVSLQGDAVRAEHASWLDLVTTAAAATPLATAVVDERGAMTYAELLAQARALAAELQRRGCQRGEIVGVSTERSRALLVAIVGIHMAGAAHLPLDPAYPVPRLRHMLRSSQARLVVVDVPLPAELLRDDLQALAGDPENAALATIDLGSLPPPPDTFVAPALTPADLAYVLYTSGSTGVPKGVRIAHGALQNLLVSVARRPGCTAHDTLLAVTTVSFDISLLELLLPLTVGARVVVARREQSEDPRQLAQLLRQHEVSILQATPATWRLLLEDGWQGGATLVAFCGGERLPPDLAANLLPRVRQLWNLYGPTETTIWSTAAEVTKAATAALVGTPLDNTVVYVLDRGGAPLPHGVPGEICIGGAGVAQGYHGQRQLTAERFLDHLTLGRLYRTGDRGRIRAGGALECLGRLDHQVKVRGFRIELGEIETALAGHADVVDSSVLVLQGANGVARLVAFVVPRVAGATATAWQEHLRRTLPEYMVPAQFVELPELPRLPNGKLDRRSLVEFEAAAVAAVAADADASPPANDDERACCTAMAAVLAVAQIGADQDFFAAGGHSLLAAQLVARLNRELGSDLTLRSVFDAPSPRQLARVLHSGAAAESPAPIVRRAERATAPATVVQERIWFLEQMLAGRPTYHLPSAHRLRGAFDQPAFEAALREIVRRQSSLRTTFAQQGARLQQLVHDNFDLQLPALEDLSALPAEVAQQRLQARLEELTAQPFDLARLPLFRSQLFRLAQDHHVWFFMPHHIVWDGWSFDVLYEELAQTYGALAAGRASGLGPLPIEYGDFAAWQRERQAAPAALQQATIWRERLRPFGRIEPLPGERPRRPGMSGVGATEWLSIDARRTQALHDLGRQHGTTLFVTTLSLYCVLLRDWARLDRLLLATPVRGREAVELESLMGCCNSLLPLVVDFAGAQTFAALLGRVKASVLESLATPDVVLEQVVAGAGSARGSVLYQALFSFQDVRRRVVEWGGLQHEMIPLFQRGATEDLGLWFVAGDKGLQGGLTYNVDVFSAALAIRLRERFVAILDQVIAGPDTMLADLLQFPARTLPVAAPVVAAAPGRRAHEELRLLSDPSGGVEFLLARLWQQVLGVANVDLEDDFFELGGNSLRAIQLVSEFFSATGRQIDLGRFFQRPTIAAITAQLANGAAQGPSSQLVALAQRGDAAPLYCLRGVWIYRHLAESLGSSGPVFGAFVATEQELQVEAETGAVHGDTVDRLAQAYVTLLQQQHRGGPLRLAGLSLGGVVAMEVARRLVALGVEVECVLLLDTILPAGHHWSRWQWLRDALAALRRNGWRAPLRNRLAPSRSTAATESVSAQLPAEQQAQAGRVLMLKMEADVVRWQDDYAAVDVPVLLARVEDHSVYGRGHVFAADYGWRRRLGPRLAVVRVAGDHLSMLMQPQVEGLASSVQHFFTSQVPPRGA